MTTGETARPAAGPGDPSRRARHSPSPAGRPGARALATAGLVYLLLAVVLWWHVWTGDPAASATCGCGDAARFIWFFEWPVFAIAHGHSVFYSQWLFHPTGINLLDDTSVLALSIGLGPVTALFGPVAGMNVGLTLAPALSALSAFALLRRWVRWEPAAFVGGLLYGFSPFVVTELALNQLNIAFLAVPPLVVLALDELIVRQRRSPVRIGLVLGLLVVLQFFLSTEVLVIVGLFTVVGVGALLVATGVNRPDARRRVGPAFGGLAVAAGVAVVLLAYPLWFLLRGPGHLSGPIWSNGTSFSEYGTTLSSFVRPGGLGQLHALSLRFGGYQGPLLPGLGYLGTGAVVVAVVGWVVWRRDRRLLLFGSLGILAALLSLQPGRGHWVPWTSLDKIPWIGNIVEARFTLVTVLCVAVMAALVVDHARVAAAERWSGPRPRAVLTGALVLLAVVPSLVVLWPNLPLTIRPVTLPRWFDVVGSRLPPGNVVLVYPVPFSGLQSSQGWQALNHMQWAQAGGGGPTGQAGRAGRARPGFEVLSAASLAIGPSPAPTRANLEAVRRALTDWGVTVVVAPVQEDLPPDERGRSSAYAVAFLTAAVGAAPSLRFGAWVWRWPPPAAIGSAGSVDPAAFDRCLASSGGQNGLDPVISCVLAQLHQGF